MEAGTLAAAFNATQALLRQRRISAGHDISDGGIAVTLLEMAFAGNTGIQVGSGSDATMCCSCAGSHHLGEKHIFCQTLS